MDEMKQQASVPDVSSEISSAKKSFGSKFFQFLVFVIILVLVGVGSFLLGVKKGQPIQKIAPQPIQVSTNDKSVLNLPSAFRSQGSTADIKTVNIKSSAKKTTSNLLNTIVPKTFAAGGIRLIVYLAPAADSSVPFANNPDNPSNPTRFQFFSYDLLSGNKQQLTRDSFAAPVDFTLSPAGTVVFSTNKQLMMINLSDLSVEDIPANDKIGYEGPFPPSVSPDGNKIAIFQGPDLIVRNLVNTGDIETFTLPDNYLKNQAVWADNGEDIYVETVRNVNGLGANDIIDVNRTTKEIKTVVTSDTAKSQIAFFDGGKYNSLLYIREILGSNMDRVLTINNLGTGPVEHPAINGFLKSLVWAPNHDKLYYTQNENINGGSFTGGVKEFEFSADKLGKVSTLLESIKSPYVYLVGFGKDENELVVSDSALNSDKTFLITSYYSFDIQSKTFKELFSFQESNKKGK
jgi:hypothetical protein